MGIIDRIVLQDDYCATFSTPHGRKVLEHLCKVSRVYKPTFVAGDPYKTAFQEGQRHIVTSILRFINKDASELIKQIEEGINNETPQ